jgi:hypothetical protein
METKLLRHLCSSHGVGKVLLVCEHEQRGVPKLLVVEQGVELLPRERDATSVAAVDDALGGRLGAMEVVLPRK